MPQCPFCMEPLPETAKPVETVLLYACPECANPCLVRWEGRTLTAHPIERTRDIRDIAPAGSIGAELLAALPAAMERLPVLPEISHRVLQMVGQPDSTMNDLAVVIREDQVIALAIMKLANSAVFGGLHAITDLGAACTRLGMKTVANTVQTVANGNLYVTGDKRLRELMQKMRRHAIATAHCAAELATLLAEPRSEMLFLAGLIHDVGAIVLLDIMAGSYSGPIGKLRSSLELQHEVLAGFSPLVGLHVVQRWNLPPEFRITTYCRLEAGVYPAENLINAINILALAESIAVAEGYGAHPAEETFLTAHPATRHLNLSDVKLATLRVDLADKLEAVFEAAGA